MSFAQVNKPKKPKSVKPKKPKYIDPFAPKSDSQLRGEASGLVSMQTNPLLEQLRRSIEARSTSGQQAIGDYTSKLQANLADLLPKLQSAYTGASQSQAATNDALAQRLGGVGSSLSSELSGKLGAINAPEAAQTQVAGGAATTATGAANAGYAAGSAELSRLLAEGAHASEFGAKLPGIAGLTGLQHTRDLQTSLSHELTNKSGDINSQALSLFASIFQHLQDQELNKAIAKGSGLSKEAELKYKLQKAAYDRALKQQALAEKKAEARAREGQQAANEAGRNSRSAAARAAQAARQKQTQKEENKRQGKWKTDKNGNIVYVWNKKTKRYERVPLPKAKSGSLTLVP